MSATVDGFLRGMTGDGGRGHSTLATGLESRFARSPGSFSGLVGVGSAGVVTLFLRDAFLR